jgi:ABC-type uncharacterized transport system substrate-binding protein
MAALSREMVTLEPEVILVQSNPGVAALRQVTSTIPIVFVSVADPVESGFVESLAHPGGNITGFSNFEASMGGKWLEALKQIAPRVTRVLALLHVEVAEGGLMSYGIDTVDLFRRAAIYVDRILRGAKPRELPVQAPSKFEMAINLKTARALGLDVPVHLQQLADEVIE